MTDTSIDDVVEEKTVTDRTPEEMIEQRHRLIQEDLKSNILEGVKGSSPVFFERLVINLLISMGYGGSIKEAGKAIGRTGDWGIDGIINEDVLGLDVIHIQAKRWNGTVGAPEIQKFGGALAGVIQRHIHNNWNILRSS